MPPRPAPQVFSPTLRRRRLERAAVNFSEHDFLHERVVDDLVDRLETVTRSFERALFYGPGAPLLALKLKGSGKVETTLIAGESGQFLKAQGVENPLEALSTALPFPSQHFDLVVSVMSLHAENDVPQALVEARRVLRPDGLFIASFPAEKTLTPLREALREAEAEVTGGVSPRVAPFVAIKDGGALLQRAGFALPVADTQPVRVEYASPLRLLHDLRGMGETSALIKAPKGALRRDVLVKVLERLAGQSIVFDMLVVTGWTPHPSQQQPLKPGSGKVSMADAILNPVPPEASDGEDGP